jgi:quinol monooxygenase YgiN
MLASIRGIMAGRLRGENGETPMIYVVADLTLKSGMAEKAAAAARQVVAGTVKEERCISYQAHLSVSDPTRMVIVERWTSREALARHMDTPHLKAWRAAGAEFIAGRKVEIITPQNVETP